MDSVRIAAILTIFTMLMLAAPAAADEGLQFEPGLWRFDIAFKMPLQDEPTKRPAESCLGPEPVGPQKLMPWAEKQGCKIKGIKVKGDRLTWKLSCDINGHKARGKGEFEVAGQEATGKTKVSFKVAGERVSMLTTWDGRRLGDCPDPPAVAAGPPPAPEKKGTE